jgi:hypothetical protein
MALHRGFVICPDSELAAVCALLETQANVCCLTTQNVETAFAFTSRIIPDLGQHQALVMGVDHEFANYFLITYGDYLPTYMAPRLELTFGMVVSRDCYALLSKELRGHIKQMGPASDHGEENGLVASRWDLEFGIDDPKLKRIINGLNEIESALVQAEEPYRIATFDSWYGEVRGDLGEAANVLGEPVATVVIEWLGRSGDSNRVTANDSEFVVEADDLSDSELL